METSAGSLAWSLHLLSESPDDFARLREEADRVLAGRAPTPDDLAKLTWARQIVDETLRLYPSGWMLTRTVRTDMSLGGHHLPAGTTVLYSPYGLQNRPDLYADAAQFRPSRWDDGATPERDTYVRSPSVPAGASARRSR